MYKLQKPHKQAVFPCLCDFPRGANGGTRTPYKNTVYPHFMRKVYVNYIKKL